MGSKSYINSQSSEDAIARKTLGQESQILDFPDKHIFAEFDHSTKDFISPILFNMDFAIKIRCLPYLFVIESQSFSIGVV